MNFQTKQVYNVDQGPALHVLSFASSTSALLANTLPRTLAEFRKLRKQSSAIMAESKAANEESRETIQKSHRLLEKAKRVPK